MIIIYTLHLHIRIFGLENFHKDQEIENSSMMNVENESRVDDDNLYFDIIHSRKDFGLWCFTVIL